MRSWRVYENEENCYVLVDELLSAQQLRILGEVCFGGALVSDRLAQRLIRKFGGYCFDVDGLHIVPPKATVYSRAA